MIPEMVQRTHWPHRPAQLACGFGGPMSSLLFQFRVDICMGEMPWHSPLNMSRWCQLPYSPSQPLGPLSLTLH